MYRGRLYDNCVSWCHQEVLEYLYENDCPRDERACDYAAKRNNFEMLRWLHKHGYPWDEETCRSALGNLEMFQWVLEHGCPFDYVILLHKRTPEEEIAVNWARENGYISSDFEDDEDEDKDSHGAK